MTLISGTLTFKFLNFILNYNCSSSSVMTPQHIYMKKECSKYRDNFWQLHCSLWRSLGVYSFLGECYMLTQSPSLKITVMLLLSLVFLLWSVLALIVYWETQILFCSYCPTLKKMHYRLVIGVESIYIVPRYTIMVQDEGYIDLLYPKSKHNLSLKFKDQSTFNVYYYIINTFCVISYKKRLLK